MLKQYFTTTLARKRNFLLNTRFVTFSAKKFLNRVHNIDPNPDIINPPKDEEIIKDGVVVKNVKTRLGRFPYFPIDDHPLVPGYSRMIPISREFIDKLKELSNGEILKTVVSVCKNPGSIEGVQQLLM